MAEGFSSQIREEIDGDAEAFLQSVNQSWIRCADGGDKFVHLLALLKKKNRVLKKVLLIANTVRMGYKLKVFLERFAIQAAVVHPGLPPMTRLRTCKEFNAGSFKYLIVIHTGKKMDSFLTQLNEDLNVQFLEILKDVSTVIHFEMPEENVGYVHRIGTSGRESHAPTSISLVSPDEMASFEELQSDLALFSATNEKFILPCKLLRKDVVDLFRYQAEDIERGVKLGDVNNAQ